MRYLFIILFQFSVLCAWIPGMDNMLMQAEGKNKKEKNKKEQTNQKTERPEIVMPVDTDIPAKKTPEEAEKERKDSIKQVNDKWKNYLSDRISEMQQLYNDISQLDSTAITKENLEEYHIEANNLKEKVDFKLGNDPLWKENNELDEMRALFSETHARTIKKLKSWEEKLVSPKTTNKWLVIGMILLAIMALVPVFSQIKAALTTKNTKKQAQKMMEQQQKEAEKRRLLDDEDNIINIE